MEGILDPYHQNFQNFQILFSNLAFAFSCDDWLVGFNVFYHWQQLNKIDATDYNRSCVMICD